ncbi:MAG TPA: S8/S53 family peptidase, partial [Actinomycetota bacterium]|nr:S8/S53 family peptidase [Actinomycetota bacterium]
DADRLVDALTRIFRPGGDYVPEEEGPPEFGRERVTAGVLRITLPDGLPPVPEVLDRLDETGLRGVGRIDPVIYVCPHACPATEPVEVPPGTVDPFPPPGLDARCPGHCVPRSGCDGDGVFVSVVDTGLLRDVATSHPWLVGVQGVEENANGGGGNIRAYAGHGTFVAGCLRCAAPRTAVFVERALEIAASGAAFESNLAPSLEHALDRSPDILVFTFTTSNRQDQSLLTFDDIYERRIRHMKGLVVLAPAGNDGQRRPMFPAAYRWVVSVGALSASWRDRAHFSNFGGWVDVFAPGENLVNAFPEGNFVSNEPPVGEQREFHGMAQWSGTSFSAPIVAGLIAARMSATGENGQQAADSLLRLARSQAIPGVGAALYPGQACCEAGHHEGGPGQARPPCGCGGHTPMHG